jgi:hypothetical protein
MEENLKKFLDEANKRVHELKELSEYRQSLITILFFYFFS